MTDIMHLQLPDLLAGCQPTDLTGMLADYLIGCLEEGYTADQLAATAADIAALHELTDLADLAAVIADCTAGCTADQLTGWLTDLPAASSSSRLADLINAVVVIAPC